MPETLVAQIRGFETAAAKIIAEIERAEVLPDAERKNRIADCCARLAPIYRTLHLLTTRPADREQAEGP